MFHREPFPASTSSDRLAKVTRDYHSTVVANAKLLILQPAWTVRADSPKNMIPSIEIMNRSCYVS